jgi:hypothetical protein
MFAHLIPSGTPIILIPFIVCIETIRNIIRPGALAVRLIANIIAGHLLITLLGNRTTRANMAVALLIIIQIFLILFETAVAMIQAYVFSVLRTLYTREVIYENSQKPPIPFSRCKTMTFNRSNWSYNINIRYNYMISPKQNKITNSRLYYYYPNYNSMMTRYYTRSNISR